MIYLLRLSLKKRLAEIPPISWLAEIPFRLMTGSDHLTKKMVNYIFEVPRRECWEVWRAFADYTILCGFYFASVKYLLSLRVLFIALSYNLKEDHLLQKHYWYYDFRIGASLLGTKIQLFTNYPFKNEFNRNKFKKIIFFYEIFSELIF